MGGLAVLGAARLLKNINVGKGAPALTCEGYATGTARSGKDFGVERQQSCHPPEREAKSRDRSQLHSDPAAGTGDPPGARYERGIVPGFRGSRSLSVIVRAPAEPWEVVRRRRTDPAGNGRAAGRRSS